MTLYRWGSKLLKRTIGGVTGLAIAETCCCGGCDDIPDTLYARIRVAIGLSCEEEVCVVMTLTTIGPPTWVWTTDAYAFDFRDTTNLAITSLAMYCNADGIVLEGRSDSGSVNMGTPDPLTMSPFDGHWAPGEISQIYCWPSLEGPGPVTIEITETPC